MTGHWSITPIPVDHPDARAILREYLTDVASRYWRRPATETEVDQALADAPGDDLVVPTGTFLVARLPDGTVTGCAGTRVVRPGVNELTKVYVRPAHRGQGGGARLVAAAEEAARSLGAETLRLDTRHDLVEARALYARTGYTEVEPFNDDKYAEHWFSKALG
ncbi:GNAT family N-acetyltransferase [Amycolatopsis carbonis]|uniref:GNAT family N-acetyltransferase n=1 Tax=Amycolatopsis carbonis TaxID=715471 RepID=A0A9Y2MYF8_9PSEU|nr:GNAT family N-acetyltransferase [Amycolatopsis sp. 2-15]WIX80019.1 GNAT family N-acetyltransferase [Amycolatopsis sp. 2-15]